MVKLTDSVNPNVKRLHGWQQLFELLLLVSLTMGICGIRVLAGWQLRGWITFWLIGSLVCFFLALRFSQHAISQYSNARFRIGPQQVQALEAAEAPQDLIHYLNQIRHRKFRGEREYFRAITKALGASRCEDLKPILFKYTFVARASRKLGLRRFLMGPRQNIEPPSREVDQLSLFTPSANR